MTRRLISIGLALALSLSVSVGCAARAYVPYTPQEAAAYSAALAVRTLAILKDAGTIASDVKRTEQILHGQGVITDAQDAAFDAAFSRLQHAADVAIDAVAVAGITASQIAAAVQPVWTAAQALPDLARVSLSTLMAVLRSALALVGV